MKTIKVNPDLLEALRAVVESQPVVGFAMGVALTAVFATWSVHR